MIMTLTIVMFANKQAFQVHMMLLSCLAQCCYLTHVHPFNEPATNRMEIFTELLILINTFCLINFTDFVLEPHKDPTQDTMVFAVETNNLMGWYNLGALGSIVVINMLSIIYHSIFDCKQKCKRRAAIKAHERKKWLAEFGSDAIMA